MTQATALQESPASQTPTSRKVGVAGSLGPLTERMAAILSARGLCVWITLGSNTALIGDQTSSDNAPIEFHFSSESVFRNVFQAMRLFDFAMAYFDGHLKISGPISKAVDVLDALNTTTDQRQSVTEALGLFLFRSLKTLRPNMFESLYHYSQNASTYELFLDNYMQYTCGHFEKGDEDINQAQLAKFHLIERLMTKYSGPLAGKGHLDIGCGWGGMGAYFESQFGTRSVGNTNCMTQFEYARHRYGSEIIFDDFSRLKDINRRFEFITIVGMIEHLTPYRRSQLLNVVNHLLKKNGIVYLQCITKPAIWIGGDAYRVAQRTIFPGHFLETDEQTESRLRDNGFRILQRCDHASDYGLTTARWVDNIQKNEAALINVLGTKGYRLYLGYLAFASKLFSTKRGSLMRYVFQKS